MTNEEIQAEIQKVVQDMQKNVVKSEERMREKAKVFMVLHELRLPGVEVPEITASELRYNSAIKVTDVRMFPVLQRVLGCTFEHYNKHPIGDGRKKMIAVSMTMKGHPLLTYDLRFEYQRKLTEHDKCKVVTENVRQTRVVCKV